MITEERIILTTITCDGCGKIIELREPAITALRFIENNGWQTEAQPLKKAKHYCLQCNTEVKL